MRSTRTCNLVVEVVWGLVAWEAISGVPNKTFHVFRIVNHLKCLNSKGKSHCRLLRHLNAEGTLGLFECEIKAVEFLAHFLRMIN